MYVYNGSDKPTTIDELLGTRLSPEGPARRDESLRPPQQPPRRTVKSPDAPDDRPLTLDDLRRRPATGFTGAFQPWSGRSIKDLPVAGDESIPFAVRREQVSSPIPTRTLFDLTNDPENGSRFLAALSGSSPRERVKYGTIEELLNTPGNPFVDKAPAPSGSP